MGRVVWVQNVSTAARSSDLEKFFKMIGNISKSQLYPEENSPIPVSSKHFFIKYESADSVLPAIQLNGIHLLDHSIPDEDTALELVGAHTAQPLPVPGQTLMVNPPFDPELAQLELPQPPPVPASMNLLEVEQLRRTVYVEKLNAKSMTDERVLDFFSQAGEVMYVRMAEPEKHSKKDKEAIPTRGAYVEFKCLSALKKALALTGSEVDNCKIKVHHSTSAITKPLYRDEEEAEEKIKSAVDLYKLAYNIVTDALASGGRSSRHSPSPLRIRTRRSRSRELSLKGVRSPRRSPTRHLSPYRRSRSPHYSSGRRYRSRSRSPYYRHRSHSRSRSHKRSHHRSNKRSRSRKRSASTKHKHCSSRSHRSRSRSKKRKHRSRSRSKKRKHRSRDRSKKKSQGSKVKLQYDDAEVNGKDINESSNEALSDQDESVAT